MADNGLEQANTPWIVKFTRRRDGRHYYFRHDCGLTARRESSMLLDEGVAKQLAEAVRQQHPDFTARAMPYPKKARKPCRKSLEKLAEDTPVTGWVETVASKEFVTERRRGER